MNIGVAALLGAIAAITCTVLSLIFITPDNKRDSLNKFFVFIHDLFNFKFLLIEKVLKVLYIFSTLFCVGFGFFGLFSGEETWGGYRSYALPFFLLLLFGPIITRLIFEGLMMFILLVRNTIEINNKLRGESSAPKTENPGNAQSQTPNDTASTKTDSSQV